MNFTKLKSKKCITVYILLLVIFLVFFALIYPTKTVSNKYDSESAPETLIIDQYNKVEIPEKIIEEEDENKRVLQSNFLPSTETAETQSPSSTSIISSSTLSKYLIKVPFVSQAPLGEWGDPMQQDGCEEAAILMVVNWINGADLSFQDAKDMIIKISEFEEDNFGNYIDTSIKDTVENIFSGFFGLNGSSIIASATKEDVIRELKAGRLVVVPADGQALNNFHFTPPGPERHMLVIIGYDDTTNEFITNDPGTRWGHEFRYDQDVLYRAIRDYPSGDHVPIITKQKNIASFSR